MTIREEIGVMWGELTGKQKAVIAIAVLLAIVLIVSGWADSLRAWSSVHKYESEAAQANRDKDDALKRAAAIAAELKTREAELSKIEDQKNAKQIEAGEADKTTSDARAEYDRAVNAHRTDTPSTDELCTQLAALGHPCQPN